MLKSDIRTANKRKSLSILLALVLALTMTMGVSVPAFAEDAQAAPVTITGGDTITQGDMTYVVDGTQPGIITVTDGLTGVVLQGTGITSGDAINGITIQSEPGTGVGLTLDDLYIASPSGTLPVIDLQGQVNTLTVQTDTGAASSALLETNGYGNGAVIHVGHKAALTLSGQAASNLYIYKSTAAAAIGGNVGEAAGQLTFRSGNYYLKGSQTGAVIGGDDTTGSTTNGDFTFAGTSVVNIEANARGAAIGASNQGACAGNVYIQDSAFVNITCDFSGAAIGHGASGTVGGNLYWITGSLLVNLTTNAIANGLTPKTAINANYAPAPYTPFVYAPASPATATTVAAGATTLYNGPVDTYMYTANTGSTPANWTSGLNSSLYLNIQSPENVTVDGNAVVLDDVSFDYDPTQVQVLVDQYNPVRDVYVVDGSYFILTATPIASGTLATVTTTTGTATPVAGTTNQWTISGVDSDGTITIETVPANQVTFAASGATGAVYVNDVVVTSAPIADGGTLDFTVVPASGYMVDPSNPFTISGSGSIVQTAGNSYQLSGVSGATTVTVNYVIDKLAWYITGNYDVSWYDSTSTAFTISTPAQLAGLAFLVNTNAGTFTGKTITLGADIDLQGYEWAPIGGAGTGYSFTGTFDGHNNTVSGLSITRLVPKTSGYGLFGSVTGTLTSFTVSGVAAPPAYGSISTTGSVSRVGAAVGYTTGDVTRVANTTTLAISGASSSGIGGVVGVAENPDNSAASTLSLQFLKNTAPIIGRSRVAGVVGAIYAAASGGVVLDQSFNTASVTSNNTAGRSYTGGLVGYDEGYITNSYNTGAVDGGAGPYTFAGGIAGLLNGASSVGGIAQLTDSFSIGAVTGTTNNALWGYVDNTGVVQVGNAYWLLPATQSLTGVNVVPEDSADGYDAADFASNSLIEPDLLSPDYYTYISGTHPTLIDNPE